MDDFLITKRLLSNTTKKDLFKLICKQIDNNFRLNSDEIELLKSNFDITLHSLETNIAGVNNKYFSRNNIPFFNPFHSGHYLTFLYYYSYYISKKNDKIADCLADKIYYLNKLFNAVDIYHKVNLPEIFFFEHPLGSVLGRAQYSSNLFIMQGCTVGGTNAGYPILGKNFSMYSNSKIIGDCVVGDNVILAANSYVKDTNIDSNKVVFGQYPNNVIKENKNHSLNFKQS